MSAIKDTRDILIWMIDGAMVLWLCLGTSFFLGDTCWNFLSEMSWNLQFLCKWFNNSTNCTHTDKANMRKCWRGEAECEVKMVFIAHIKSFLVWHLTRGKVWREEAPAAIAGSWSESSKKGSITGNWKGKDTLAW